MPSRVNSSGSEWRSLSSNDSLSQVLTRTGFSQYQPVSISFACSRRSPNASDPNKVYIDSDIFKVFMNAVKGKSHEDMVENPGSCPTGGDTHHCGNNRGHLWECRCKDLNRKVAGFRRLQFENHVIFSIVHSQKISGAQESGTPFEFNLAIFCSGGLLGEEILLFRLFNELRNRGASGKINLFLIDRCYKETIKIAEPDQLITQFLKEICGCLPPSIKVNGTFFGDAKDYIQAARKDPQFKHDLLIGADLEGAETLMGEITKGASISFEQEPIVLVRKDNKKGVPSVCRINLLGEHENCYQPYDDQPFRWGLVVGGICIAIVAAALGIIASESKTSEDAQGDRKKT